MWSSEVPSDQDPAGPAGAGNDLEGLWGRSPCSRRCTHQHGSSRDRWPRRCRRSSASHDDGRPNRWSAGQNRLRSSSEEAVQALVQKTPRWHRWWRWATVSPGATDQVEGLAGGIGQVRSRSDRAGKHRSPARMVMHHRDVQSYGCRRWPVLHDDVESPESRRRDRERDLHRSAAPWNPERPRSS